MLDSENISCKIREIRLEMGLTQEQFAAKLGVSFPTVNRWENQKAKPSPLAIQKLQKLFSNYKRKDRLKQNNIKEKGDLIGVI
jgi:transcriptional regulator with XRE-family HTH domain